MEELLSNDFVCAECDDGWLTIGPSPHSTPHTAEKENSAALVRSTSRDVPRPRVPALERVLVKQDDPPDRPSLCSPLSSAGSQHRSAIDVPALVVSAASVAAVRDVSQGVFGKKKFVEIDCAMSDGAAWRVMRPVRAFYSLQSQIRSVYGSSIASAADKHRFSRVSVLPKRSPFSQSGEVVSADDLQEFLCGVVREFPASQSLMAFMGSTV